MSEFKGTPGPWFYSGKHEECQARYVGTSTERDPLNEVAVLFTGGPEERQANANLIAAAPELLEALQESMKIWESSPLDVSEASILLDCRAAIAKALGQ
jgi:hypothetical protein